MTDRMNHEDELKVSEIKSLWGVPLEITVCEQCDWNFLLPSGFQPQRCPYCFHGSLIPLEAEYAKNMLYVQPPELYMPHTLSEEKLILKIRKFTSGYWFAPKDLNSLNLQGRLKRIFFPMWLVDSDVEAAWEAEVGFNYQVVSHQDHYDDANARWASREVKETRIRWEPRVGRLSRSYHNITAPALEEHTILIDSMGRYRVEDMQPYKVDGITQSFVCLPNRSQEDAWPSVVPDVQSSAAAECLQATEADHIRDFRWTPKYQNLNWTLLLLPAYTTYYLDDQEIPQSLIIHGQTGFVSGKRRASMKRARRASISIILVGVVMLFISLLLLAVSPFLPLLLVLGGAGLLLSILVGFAAIVPPLIVWRVNRNSR